MNFRPGDRVRVKTSSKTMWANRYKNQTFRVVQAQPKDTYITVVYESNWDEYRKWFVFGTCQVKSTGYKYNVRFLTPHSRNLELMPENILDYTQWALLNKKKLVWDQVAYS
jgi:hypothetical protein